MSKFIIHFSVESCGDILTASTEQKVYEITQPEDGRSCTYNISTTLGNGIAFTIGGGGNHDYQGEPEGEPEGEYNSSGSGHLQYNYIPELCNQVIVTIVSSRYYLCERTSLSFPF